MIRARRWSLLAALSVIPVACSPSDGGDPASVPCDQETRDDTWVVGLEKTGTDNVLRTTLDAVAPEPPNQGFNDWTLSVLPVSSATPVGGCTVTATPRMPDHNHGTSPAQPVLLEGATGEYSSDQLNFFMSGLWEITIELDCGGSGSDEVVYRFCVEG